jgi:hypothetical protein
MPPADSNITHVSDTALMVAACRAHETELEDAFVRDPDGTFSVFGPPGVKVIVPLSINDGGTITGYYQASVYTTSHGFILEP